MFSFVASSLQTDKYLLVVKNVHVLTMVQMCIHIRMVRIHIQ